MSHKVEIGISNGVMKTTAHSEIMKKTKCFRCQQEIFIVTTTHGHKLPVSKDGGKLVTHALKCPHSEIVKAEKAKQQKYVKEFNARAITLSSKRKGSKNMRDMSQGSKGSK